MRPKSIATMLTIEPLSRSTACAVTTWLSVTAWASAGAGVPNASNASHAPAARWRSDTRPDGRGWRTFPNLIRTGLAESRESRRTDHG